MLRSDPEETEEKKVDTEIVEEKTENGKMEEKTSPLDKGEPVLKGRPNR